MVTVKLTKGKKMLRRHLQIAAGGCATAITFGLMSGSVLAGKTHEEITGKPYDNTKAPYESPHKAEPPVGGHSSLATAATNPIANLVQVQLQNQYNAKNWGVDGYSNAAIVQPVIPFKLPSESVPTMVTRTTIPYVTTPDLPDPVGRESNIGDIVGLGFFLPKKWQSKEHMFGLGPALSAPRAMTTRVPANGRRDPQRCTSIYRNPRCNGACSPTSSGPSPVTRIATPSANSRCSPLSPNTSKRVGMSVRRTFPGRTISSPATGRFLSA